MQLVGGEEEMSVGLSNRQDLAYFMPVHPLDGLVLSIVRVDAYLEYMP